MNLEIEAKIKIENFEAVVESLRLAEADFVGTAAEDDYYFDSAENTLLKSDRGLRLRKRTSQDLSIKDEIILTYKGPREDSIFKSRGEAEVAVDDFERMKKILIGLGFKQGLKIEKLRQIWQLDNCEVCLDQVAGLGRFVEVEGPDEIAVGSVLKKINLSRCEHICEGYARMMADKQDIKL